MSDSRKVWSVFFRVCHFSILAVKLTICCHCEANTDSDIQLFICFTEEIRHTFEPNKDEFGSCFKFDLQYVGPNVIFNSNLMHKV